MSLKLLLPSLAVGLFLSLCGAWTTVASYPSTIDVELSGCGVGDEVFLFYEPSHKYTVSTDVWTTLPPMPSAFDLFAFGMACLRSSSTHALLFGGALYPATSVLAIVLDYNADTAVWTSHTEMPGGMYGSPVATDSQNVWVISGAGLPSARYNQNWEYNTVTDVWTSKTAAPTNQGFGGCAYTDGIIGLLGGLVAFTMEIYTVATDVWTTAQDSPTDRLQNRFGLLGVGGVFFSLDGTETAAFSIFESFSPSTGWVTLASVPTTHTNGVEAMTSNGVIVVIGQTTPPSHQLVHTYATGLGSASVVGDPFFTSFGGTTTQLHLWPGVFNLYSSHSLVVNAAIERLPSLPPEEDQVITMLGLAHFVRDTVHLGYCAIQLDKLSCSTRSFPPSASALKNSQTTPSSFVAENVEVKVQYARLIIKYMTSDLQDVYESTHLNVFLTGAHGPNVSGLLNDIDTRGVDAVRESLSEYVMLDGCLFGVEFPRSHTPPHPMLEFC